METRNNIPSSQSGSHFLHPILWLKHRCSDAESRRRQFSMPYSVELPVLPSNLHARWHDLCGSQAGAQMENNIFHYEGDEGLFFTALLEVNRWQGVFSFSAQKEKRSVLTPVEFWGMALREHSNLETQVPGVEKAQGAVFWQNGILNVYPADLGQAFEGFLREKLLS